MNFRIDITEIYLTSFCQRSGSTIIVALWFIFHSQHWLELFSFNFLPSQIAAIIVRTIVIANTTIFWWSRKKFKIKPNINNTETDIWNFSQNAVYSPASATRMSPLMNTLSFYVTFEFLGNRPRSLYTSLYIHVFGKEQRS